jgi:hypothetical protein
VGLPRTNLVKKSSEVASPVASAPAPFAPTVAAVAAVAANPFAVPSPFAAGNPFAPGNPFAAAAVGVAGNPFAASAFPAPVPVPAPVIAAPAVDVARESYQTTADSVEVAVSSERAPETYREPTAPVNVADPPAEPMRGQYASSPSANELLERAAALGPARMTWESIVLPADPILSEKQTAHVTERRARLTRVVKITLAACLGVCVLALGVSAISSDSRDSSPPAEVASASAAKTVPSKGIIPVEPLDGTKHAKAARRVAPAVTTAAIVRTKRR